MTTHHGRAHSIRAAFCSTRPRTLRAALRATTCAAALLGGATLATPAAWAFEVEPLDLTISLTPTLSTDYLFRGLSQTRNRPAAQFAVDIQHASGFYAGAFISNVAFLGTDARQEVDALAGWRKSFGPATIDLGGIAYTYPGYNHGSGTYDLTYYELVAKGGYEVPNLPLPVKLLGAVNYSPNYQAESGTGLYAEGGIELTLPYDVTLAGRAGYQWIQNNPRWGSPDYANWNITLSHKFYDFVLTVGYYDTDLRRSECFGQQKICDARAMVLLTRTF